MSANEIANALIAGGMLFTSGTPADVQVLEGAWGILGAERISAGLYKVNLENAILVNGNVVPPVAQGLALVTQATGATNSFRAQIAPPAGPLLAHAGHLILETFTFAAPTVPADVVGFWSFAVMRAPSRG